MKMIFTLMTSFLAAVAAFGQIPQSFNYQAIARDRELRKRRLYNPDRWS